MKWKTKARKAIKAATADEFFSWKNPLLVILFLIVLIWIIEKVVL